MAGDILIERGGEDRVVVFLEYAVEPEGTFRGDATANDGRVVLRERWGSESVSGTVLWTIRIPESLTPFIDLRTSSGDLEANGVELDIRFRTSSGDIGLNGVTVRPQSTFRTSSGDFELIDTNVGEDVELRTSSGDVTLRGVTSSRAVRISTSSGNVHMERSSGVLELQSSSGDVRISHQGLSGPSRFTSSSGNVVVQLETALDHDLEASSSSGRVSLNVEQLPPAFTLILTKRIDRGRITAPFNEYTSSRTFVRGRNRFEERVLRRGTGGPTIRLGTASGSIDLVERSQGR